MPQTQTAVVWLPLHPGTAIDARRGWTRLLQEVAREKRAVFKETAGTNEGVHVKCLRTVHGQNCKVHLQFSIQ